MKIIKNISLLLLLFANTLIFAQRVEQPVTWSISTEKSGDGLYVVKVTGNFDPNRPQWHIYGLGPYEDGPTPTTLTIESADGKSKGFELVGKPYLISKEKKVFDEMFGMEIGICEDKVIVAQKVKVLTTDSLALFAIIEWQACDDQSCLPPTDKEFTVKLGGASKAAAKSNETPASNKEAVKKGSDSEPAQAASATTTEPSEGSGDSAAQESQEQVEEQPAATEAQPAATQEESLTTSKEKSSGKSIWGVIIEAIIWGFVALLTPCVFPMVPMTVSFFLKQNQDNQNKSGGSARGRAMASLFGFSIVALYTLPIAAIIVITYFAGGEAVTADIFNWLATHWVPNILFFVIFMVFAASFFGAFEIVLPSWMISKSDSKSDKGGYAGVFFMALTLVLVSFSCTGPIVGTILIKSTQGEIWEPIITMLAFSLAFALPFTIFAFAPSLLKDLPKSGGWLNSVKVVLGFIEVALGFKFLSVADQVYHWGLLDREVYLAIWIVVFTLMGFYLLGKLRFAHDTPEEYITVKRLAFSIITFSFVVYMIPGMWGAPLKALSGYLPPMSTQDFRLSQSGTTSNNNGNSESTFDATSALTTGGGSLSSQGVTPMYSDFLHLPHNLEGFFRYEEGMAYARKVGKPVFIDFTGHGCVNCREMEARVWSDPRVLKMLREDFVLIALYADDKKTAVESDWITSDNGRQLKSIGKINAHLAMNKYNVNAQPYYAIIDPATEEHLTDPRGYNLDVELFLDFLKRGLEGKK